MVRKTVLSIIATAMLAGSCLSAVDSAQAQQYNNRPPDGRNWDGQPPGPPPPPPQKRHHHNNTGAVIAGGVAAGIIGGLLGGAVVNGGGYEPPPPPPPPRPRCWYEDRPVHNQYDDGWHNEQIRVCD